MGDASSGSRGLWVPALVLTAILVGAAALLLDRGDADESGEFWCPMDPQIVRPRQGSCPICSMELVPFEGSAGAEAGVLQLTDRQVQQAGVRIGRAEVRDLVREIDTTGRLEIDPTRRTVVALRFPGRSRIERMHFHTAGETVNEGAVLVEVANPLLEELLEEYRGALKAFETARRENPDQAPAELMRMSGIKNRFEAVGIPGPTLNNYAAKPKHRFTTPYFPLLSPYGGTILADPEIHEGLYVQEGKPLFELASFDSLWLYLDLYESELPFVEVGQKVEFTTRAVPEQDFRATIRFLEPVVQERTRTVRARCRVGSARGKLSPGMFVRARIRSNVPGILSVPESAVLQSGRRNVVIVAEGAGRFRPKLVDLGRSHLSAAGPDEGEEERFGAHDERYHEILSGLEPGDQVVVAGNFLLNAEAQFQGVLKKMFDAAEARDAAPELPEGTRSGVDALIAEYDAIGRALVDDDGDELERMARSLAEDARAVTDVPAELAPILERLASAADRLAEGASSGEDLEAARKHFGSLSRELVAYLREFEPARVSEGELHLFRCPMADDYGFDMWVQLEPGLQNPYMGQSMPDCGMPAELQ